MSLDPNNPAEVAHSISLMMEQLEELTVVYRDDINRAAKSSSAYKLTWARSMLGVIDGSDRRMTVQEREARVEVASNDARTIAEIDEARAKATREALNSLRVRLDAARSLGANLRAQV